MKNKTLAAVFAPLAMLLATSASQAALLPAFDTNGNEFLLGDGIGIEGFTVDGNAANGDPAVALRARNRDDMNPTNVAGNVYTIDAGLSQIQDPTQPQLQFEFQFTPGASGDNYFLELSVDFDLSAATSFATIGLPVSLTAVPSFSWAGSTLNNGECGNGPCTWGGDAGSDAYAVSNSWNLGFGFWSTVNPAIPAYDPNAAGLYDITLTAYEFDDANLDFGGLTDPVDIAAEIARGVGSQVASVSIQAQVVAVSEPHALGLFGLSLVSLMMGRRKRKL